jgi:hypothetical protein
MPPKQLGLVLGEAEKAASTSASLVLRSWMLLKCFVNVFKSNETIAPVVKR